MFELGDIIRNVHADQVGIVTEVSRTGRDWVRYTLADGSLHVTETGELELVLRVPEVAYREIEFERQLAKTLAS